MRKEKKNVDKEKDMQKWKNIVKDVHSQKSYEITKKEFTDHIQSFIKLVIEKTAPADLDLD
jgi:hypothetical protein